MPPKSGVKPSRTPKDDPRLGDIDDVLKKPAIDHPPNVLKYGLCPKPKSPAKPTGDTMMVRSNYVQVTEVPKTLYAYSLTFFRTTEEGHRLEYNKRREIRDAYQALMKADALKLKAESVKSVTDFKTLWTDKHIIGHTESDVTFSSNVFEYTQQNGKLINDMYAEVSFVDELSDIKEALKSKHIKDLPEYIRALNASVAQCIFDHSKDTGKEISRVGANKFYITNGYKEMKGLRAGRGYFTSIRPGTESTLLSINPATSAFLPPITVSDFIKSIGKDKLVYVSQLLRGATLRIRYTRANYEESDIDYNSEAARLKIFTQIGPYFASQQKFYELEKKVDGQERKAKGSDHGTTVQSYFTDKAKVRFPAGATAKSPEMYCINVGKRVDTLSTKVEENTIPNDTLMRKQSAQGAQWIPACLLQIVPNQVVTTTLGPVHTSQMIRHALRLPAENVGLIEDEGLEIMGVKSDSQGQKPLAKMNFAVGDELIEVPATLLPQPKLSYGNGSLGKMIICGSWDVKGVKFASPAGKFKSISILAMPGSFYGTEKDLANEHENFIKLLKGHGLKFEDMISAEQVCTKGSLFEEGEEPDDREILGKFLNKYCWTDERCGLVLIPEHNYDTYAMVKRLADFNGMIILLATGTKFTGGDQIGSNIALKINMRYGGYNHNFDPAEFNNVLSLGRRKNTIVIGADIAHCGGGGKEGSPSIACLVGSNTSAFMSYPGSMRLQRGGQELINDDHMYSMIQERLRTWKKWNYKSADSSNKSKKKSKKDPNNPEWPANMIFFRDGISESQFEDCIEHEIQQIKKAYRELCGQELNLTFIVCGKRHHTRFYATEEDQTYKQKLTIDNQQILNATNGNVQPGLLVTSVVTNPEPFNFFLQSHKAIKGTARSAHYHVLEDGMGLGPERLPKLTMMLCYAFGRSTTGVSYAAPAYLADRLCERGRVYLRPWLLDPDMEPKFKVLDQKDANGKRTRISEEEMNEAKAKFAETLSKTESVWGKHYGKDVDGQEWKNPWRPNLCERDGMFWM